MWRIMRPLCGVRALFAALLIVSVTNGAVAAGLTPERDALEKQLRGHEYRLRPWAGTCRTFYASSTDSAASVTFLPGVLVPVRPGTTVTIRSVDGDARAGFRVRFEAARRRGGVLLLHPALGHDLDSQQAARLFAIAFLGEAEADEPPALEGSSSGALVHLPFCNHGPSGEPSVRFATLDAAKQAGRRACPACFRDLPDVSGVLEELQLGRETEQAVRYRYPIVVDSGRQEHLRKLGETVTSRWPLPLKGYRYHFTLVESDELNAFACPGGHVFVTSALYEASESDAELRAVLAHEIAHVELRHGYRQFRSAQTVGFFAGLFGAVAAGVLANNGGPDLTLATADLLAQLGAMIVLTGYSREHEIEADAFACVYSEREAEGRAPFTRALRKLQFAQNASGVTDAASVFSSHPGIESRIASAGNATIAPFDSSATFIGFDREGNPAVRVRLESQGHYERLEATPSYRGRPGSISSPSSPRDPADVVGLSYRRRHDFRVYATFQSLGVLTSDVRWRSLELATDDGIVVLENSEKTEMGPNDEVGAAFATDKRQTLIRGRIHELRTPLVPEIVHWEQAAP